MFVHRPCTSSSASSLAGASNPVTGSHAQSAVSRRQSAVTEGSQQSPKTVSSHRRQSALSSHRRQSQNVAQVSSHGRSGPETKKGKQEHLQLGRCVQSSHGQSAVSSQQSAVSRRQSEVSGDRRQSRNVTQASSHGPHSSVSATWAAPPLPLMAPRAWPPNPGSIVVREVRARNHERRAALGARPVRPTLVLKP